MYLTVGEAEKHGWTAYEQAEKVRVEEEASICPNLYGSSQTFLLDTLQLSSSMEEVAVGGYGSIYVGTLQCSYGVRHKLYRGIWRSSRQPQDSYRYFSKESPVAPIQQEEINVAVKKVRVAEDEVLELTREACNLRVLQGARNVVNVYGVIRSKQLQSTCIVMDLVAGPHGHPLHLNKFLRQHPPAANASWWKKKLEIFMELVMGISLCHKRGVYHGDLKGENILLDEFLVPKLIDFGLSFTRRDTGYLNSLGGSLFWVSPEILDAQECGIPAEVLEDPYPSDVYSLGIILVEMFLDGKIESALSSNFNVNKLQGGSPVELSTPAGMDEFEPVFDILVDLVEQCCVVDREDRISLHRCLMQVQAAFSELCSLGTRVDPGFVGDAIMTSCVEYKQMLKAFQERFPAVPEFVVLQPTKNMMVDIEGNLLVHLFCRLDFCPGVEFIIDRGSWNFKAEKDVPYMCTICVKEGSLRVLKLLGSRWKDIILQDEWLVHEACTAQSNADLLRFLISDIGLSYDTWHRSEHLKPLHKLAYQGKIEMMKVVLDCARSIPDYVNTVAVPDVEYTPLFYAIEGDNKEAVLFLLEKGAALKVNSKLGVQEAFIVARECGCLSVMIGLLETDHYRCLLRPTILNHQDSWHLLKDHLEDSTERGLDPFRCGCFEGNESIFKLIISFCKDVGKPARIHTKLCSCLGAHGNKKMAEYALENVGMWLVSGLLDVAQKHKNRDLIEFLTELKQQEQRQKHAERKKSTETRGTHREGNVGAEEELRAAVQSGNIFMVESKLHSPVSWVDLASRSAFLGDLGRICCKKGHLVILKLLVHHGLDVMHLGLLHNASYFGHMNIVEYLLKKGAAVNAMSPAAVGAPLKRAIEGQHYEIAKVLLDAGADPNARDFGGYTCMDPAVGYSNRKLIRLLIAHGFDTGMKNTDNEPYIDLISMLGRV